MFSKSCKYGIRAVLYLAVNSSEDKKLGVKEISENLEVPKHFLAKILQQLSRHGLISSTKGPSGGFFMNDKDLKKPLRLVVESIDGPDVFHSCILGLPVCSSDNPCPLHDTAADYRTGLLELLEEQNVREVARKIKEKDLSI